MKYFVAGVGRALLFKGTDLFADARTLADSSITIGVTAEEIRGGEGNQLFGQYFHDSSFSMKLTDIMFDLAYIAANTGAEWSSKGDIFMTETLMADSTGKITLTKAPVPVVTNGKIVLYYRDAAVAGGDYSKKTLASNSQEVELGEAYIGKEICVMYRYTNQFAEKITISSQFIPDTLHAVLTVALYAGDSCNVEDSTKVGEVTIDVPRFQLSGAMDITMSATGAAQSSLEGNALASGCSGCDNKATYATITKVIFAQSDENISGIIVEDSDNMSIAVGESRELTAYATFENAAPIKVDAVFALDGGSTYATLVGNVLTGKAPISNPKQKFTATYGGKTAEVEFVVTAKE